MSRTFPLLGLLTAAILSACASRDEPTTVLDPYDPATAEYVGGVSCTRCHRVEASYWKGSHHDLAMQQPTGQTVLGDFDDATFTYAGVTSRFFRRDGRFFVETDGPDGELAEYPIAYTIGVVPLQQVLIELPGGRLQALSICWDTRPAAAGGQRWFHLYPDLGIDHEDELHWTGLQQNWNHMCAECHTTNLVKGYDAEAERFDTTWSELDVSCEACHGPGSAHLAWAEAKARNESPPEVDGSLPMGLAVRLKDPGRGTWIVSRETGKGLRLALPVETAELETCARCHSRRGAFSSDYVHGQPLGDTHRLALLDEGLYHADGQILDEVYVYGSYLQSKMHREGVTCSDCHEPHGLDLLFPGDKVCARCHAVDRFETKAHHFHEPGKEGSRCVDCHMPPKTYMVIDPRHDHSLRVPRPDLSLTTGAPNACSDCHGDKSVEWAVAAVERWYGPERLPGPDPRGAIWAGRIAAVEAEGLLAATIDDPAVSGIVRATAVSLLSRYLSTRSLPPLDRAVRDRDPLVRSAAARALQALPPGPRVERAVRLLGDPVRSVRMEAARALAGAPTNLLDARQRDMLARGLAEYRAAQAFDADRPESWTQLGTLDAELGDPAAAEAALRKALAMDPAFVPAYLNLADVHRASQRDEEGEEVLRRGLAAVPEAAALRHALGLLLVRRGDTAQALVELERAATKAPGETRYAYAYGVALHSTGAVDRALEVLAAAHEKAPADRDVLQALATMHRDAGDLSRALGYARKLAELSPGDAGARQLLLQLESASS